MSADLQVTGLAEMEKRLELLPDRVARKLIGNAARSAANIIKKQTEANAPVKSGKLKGSFKIRGKAYKPRKGGSGYVAKIGVNRSGVPKEEIAYHANIIEGGAKPHIILARRERATGRFKRTRIRIGTIVGRAKRKKALKLPRGFRFEVHHPGIEPRHFMLRATEQKGQASIDRFALMLGRGIDREIKKMGGG